ncbi:MAG: alpha/beta fold hydrolase [Thermoplasmata archaeon]|nr:MAG: alpha/beta fold hydrolase [Thermoplasmata archaeon]
MKNTSWLDREEYPFKSNFLQLDMGRMLYIDVGKGEPIVMFHGNPTWSFLYRHIVKGLSKKYRCIAMDYLGFGLSDKPSNWSYLPEDHAKNIQKLIEALDLKEITLIVQDWGGPIGLSYAINNPNNVKRIIIMNTWMWSIKGDSHFERFSKFLGGRFGRFLIMRLNFFVRVVMKLIIGDRSKLPKSIHRHYIMPLKNPKERIGCWVFPKEIIGSDDWVKSLWSLRKNIEDKPTLILWGMKDSAFREQELKKWEELFSNHKTVKFENVGHYVQEEIGNDLCPIIENFLSLE